MLQRELPLGNPRLFFVLEGVVYGTVVVQGVGLYASGVAVGTLHLIFFGVNQL